MGFNRFEKERAIANRRKRVRVIGVVQGVGFRPFVWKRARGCELSGWVRNDSSGVTIEVQGAKNQLQQFLTGFEDAAPPLARIDSLDVVDIDAASQGSKFDFSILDSSELESKSTLISPEISVCADCFAEFNDPNDRRFEYPFINCTNCGPRFTIIEDIPYDRSSTTMKSFLMCKDCQREYDDPSDRRFHAQPNACPSCGPSVWFMNSSANNAAQAKTNWPTGSAAINNFQNAMKQGLIVAVKGIGGFHLVCDATNDKSIEMLRQRKGRIEKPLAVMVRNVEQAEAFAVVDDQERKWLESKERPIVLLSKKTQRTEDGGGSPGEDALLASRLDEVSNLVAPGNDFVGVMLPYSPLHYLLVDKAPLVMTSGNLTDEPIVRTNNEATRRLERLADCFLLHNRKINIVCDDSVVRCVNGKLLPIRRSRGYAPMPVRLRENGPSVLAVGGEVKSTFCVTKDNYAYMSQHIGNMENLETLNAMRRSVEHFLRLFRIEAEAVVADLHPGYLSGQWAEELARSMSVPLIRVQHHFAHIVSLIAEHQPNAQARNFVPHDASLAHRIGLGEQIMGACFDGTGYGTDGAIWGGEFMLANESTFVRFAHLRYTPLPGGDSSIRRPYRVALANLWSSQIDWDERLPCVAACPKSERKILHQQLENNLNCMPTSSMGRLFDAVSSLIGVRHEVNYEAQAAMELEALAASFIDAIDSDAYSFQITKAATSLNESETVAEPTPTPRASEKKCESKPTENSPLGLFESGSPKQICLPDKRSKTLKIGSDELLRQICADVVNGVDRRVIAAQFHHAVANLVVDVSQTASEGTRKNRVGLTGGVFQNALLLKLTTEKLSRAGFDVLTHSVVPPNDGGIALGQAMVARNQLAAAAARKKRPESKR